MTTPLVEIRNLSISFQRDDQLVKVVEGINLTIYPGETVALVGESGSGKSVTARALIGLSGPIAIVKADLFEIDGLSVLDYRDKEWRGLRGNKIGFVLQDALVSLDPLRRISQQLSDAFGVKGFFRRPDVTDRSKALLRSVGIPDPDRRLLQYPHQLSGGQRKRVQMAQALITGPKVILMDEPFSALDIHTRHLMQNELLRLWQEERRAVVMITHDLEEAIALGDRVVVLAAGPRSRVIDSFPVDLDRPRDVAEIKLDSRFMDLYRNIWASLRGEVEKSYERHD